MKAVQIKDFLNYSNLGNLKTKGKNAVFVKALPDNDKQDHYNYTLQMLKNDQVSALSSFGKEQNFVFETEKTVLFTGNRQNKENKTVLYRLSLDGGEAQPIAEFDHANYKLEKIINQNELLLSRRVDLNEKAKKGNPNSDDYDIFDETPAYFNNEGILNKHRDRLFTYNLQTKKLTELLADDPYFQIDQSWLKDNLLFFTGGSFKRKAHLKTALYKLNFGTGKLDELIPCDQYEIFDLFFINDQTYVVASDQKEYGCEENPQIYLVNEKSHQLSLVASWDKTYGNAIIGDICLLETKPSTTFNNQFYFLTTVTDHNQIMIFDGQKIKPYFEFDGSIDYFTFQNDGNLLFTGAKNNELQELYQVADGKLTQLSHFNDVVLIDVYVAQAHQINYESTKDGIQHGWLLYPRNFGKNKKYPAILDVHGGPKGSYSAVFFHEMQVWASHGYFVLFANIHGSDGQGNDYADMRGQWGKIDYQDLMKFVDTVLKETPAIDQQKLCITGGSYGGYMTNWAIGQTDRFCAAASQRSMANWFSDPFLSDIGPWDDFYALGINNLNDNPEFAWQQSPLKYTDHVKTPTLFLNSDQDYRCPMTEGLQMSRALNWHNVETRMIIFHGENHELSRSGKPKNRIKRLEEITNWFDHYTSNK
ncbi:MULTISPECIES: alpha/beta hydrolase family protein [Lactobacillus]|uniref:alpha/beta hydrolase family protein n=1 Tax=Lactobacillus TaxID=1578 RepID=UPI00248FCDA4|nr:MULTISPECIES: S9 family peptidase [Lactobacillus]